MLKYVLHHGNLLALTRFLCIPERVATAQAINGGYGCISHPESSTSLFGLPWQLDFHETSVWIQTSRYLSEEQRK